jgi:2'-5' RNA ligase
LAPIPSFAAARDQFVRAQQRFRVSALNRLMPTTHGTVRTRVLLREQRLGNLYRLAMEGRLRSNMRRIGSDRTIDDGERQRRLRKLLATERRYLMLHIASSSNRLERTAELERLRETTDAGAYWHMDPTKKTHTADCVAMEGRVWPWRVLERVNPANRHPGCGCRLLSIREAQARGFPVRWGRVIPQVALQEAAKAAPDGAMVALYPPEELARKLAVEGGEKPEELHITLVFLGKADSIGDPGKLRRVVEGWAASTPPMKGKMSGLGVFAPSKSSDGKLVTYLPGDIPELTKHRERLAAAIEAIGHKIPAEHGFAPHMTLAYGDKRDVEPVNEPVAFERAALVIAGERQDFALGGEQKGLREIAATILEARRRRRRVYAFTGTRSAGAEVVPHLRRHMRKLTAPDEVITGAQHGVDTHAALTAMELWPKARHRVFVPRAGYNRELVAEMRRRGASIEPVRPGPASKHPYLVRNDAMLDAATHVIAVPKTSQEEQRGSGSWYTIRHARERELPVRMLPLDDLLQEVDVPVRPGTHGGNPHHDRKGRFTTVHGEFHHALHDAAAAYFDAVRAGDGAAMKRRHRELRDRALALSHGHDRISPKARDEQVRLVDRVHARAVVPSGAQVPYGHAANIGGTRVEVPRVPHEEHGLKKGWDERGRFSWLIGPNSLGRRTAPTLGRLKESEYFDVQKSGSEWTVRTRDALTTAQAHAGAIELEARLNELRTRRIRSGKALADDRPLDLTAELAPSYGNYTRHPRIGKKELGDTGEALMGQIADAMATTRDPRTGELMFPDAVGPLTAISLEAEARGEKQTNLDAGIGSFGGEFKSTPLRTLTAGRAEASGTGRKTSFGGSSSPEQQRKKLALAERLGLRPLNVYPIVDLDAGVAYVFVHAFQGHYDGEVSKDRPRGKWVSDTGEKVFAERRIPVELQTALIDGTARVGHDYKPTRVKAGKGEPTVFLGEFELPLSHLRIRDRTPALLGRAGKTKKERRERQAQAVLSRIERAPPRRRQREALQERDTRILEMARSGRYTQGQIAEAVGLKQPAVSTILRKKHGFHTGQGRRADLRG